MAFQTGSSSNYLDLLDDLVTFATSNGWTVRAETQEAFIGAIAAGGSGYTNGDLLTLVGGVGVTTPAVFQVTGEAAGVVTSVTLITPGLYDYPPSDPVFTTGGTGTGCTLNVTFVSTTQQPKKVTLEGTGTGADEIFVSIAAQDFGGGAFNWDIRGHVGFQDEVDYTVQPNTSPVGSYVPLNNAPITYWFFVTPLRIIAVFRVGSTYTNMYLGWLNRFGTAQTYPYPLCVMGCASQSGLVFSDSLAGMSGLVDPMNASAVSTLAGPGFVIDPGGTWKTVRNSGGSAGSRQRNNGLGVWPPFEGYPSAAGRMFQWSDAIPPDSGPAFVMGQTPDSTATTGFRFPLLPATVIERSPVPQILGEMDNVRWAGTIAELTGQAVSEDLYNINGDDYILFQNVNRTDAWAFVLIKRE